MPERQAVEFGVEIGEYRGVVRVPRRIFQHLVAECAPPERCVEAYYLQRPRFESIVERKIRRRQLTDDGNVEIGGRVCGRCEVRPVPTARERLKSTHCGQFPHDTGWTAVDPKQSLVAGERDGAKCP
jgi:hypothetical protein